MKSAHPLHPTKAQLQAFAQGELSPDEFALVAAHVEQCDDCCVNLATQPDNTLIALAREVATLGHLQPGTMSSQLDQHTIPAALQNHPRYRVNALVGVGGMGAVYQAEHLFMQRMVALKVVHPRLLKEPSAVERFEREVRLAAKLAHPNIVVAYDADRADDHHFLVMEFVDGLTLDRWVVQHGPSDCRTACNWIRQAALGLQHAHELGMAHRDIKPQNLIVTADGQVRILDFGLSRLVAVHDEPRSGSVASELQHSHTQADMVLGTPDYIAPEQILKSREADIRADIYSLGCTLFYLLCGKPPLRRSSIRDTLNAHLNEKSPAIESLRSDVPRSLAAILNRMLAKQPGDRYQTPAEVAEALATVVRELDLHGNRPVPIQNGLSSLTLLDAEASTIPLAQDILQVAAASAKTSKQTRRHRRWMIAACCGVLLLATGGAGLHALGLAPWLHRQSRLLVLLPSEGLWYPDYQSLVNAATPQRMDLTFASLAEHPSKTHSSSPPGIAVPDIRLDEQVRAENYDGIVFIGYDTREFSPQSAAGAEVARLLNEFQMQKKIIASVCAGQRVLAQHGALRGKSVAPTQSVTKEEVEVEGAQRLDQSVVVDGLVVTCADAQFTGDLLEAVQKLVK